MTTTAEERAREYGHHQRDYAAQEIVGQVPEGVAGTVFMRGLERQLARAHVAGHRSRDAEVRELEARVSELGAALDYVQRRCTLYGAADQARAKIDDVLAESRSEVRELVEGLRGVRAVVGAAVATREEVDTYFAAIERADALLARYKEEADEGR